VLICAIAFVPLVTETVGVCSAADILAGLGGGIWACANAGGCDATPGLVISEGTGPDWIVTLTSLMVPSCCVMGFGDKGLAWPVLEAAGSAVEDSAG
jgi:hypothetical protein